MYKQFKEVYMVPREGFSDSSEVSDIEGLTESISNIGMIEPVIARLNKSVLEVISGKRRINAVKTGDIPTVILDIDDNKAKEIRTELIISKRGAESRNVAELSHLVSDYYSSIKAQGKRTDLIDSVKQISSLESSGEKFKLSARTISRYLRLDKLCIDAKRLIDNGGLSIKAGVELSYLSYSEQIIVVALIQEGHQISVCTASKLRELSSEKKLNVLEIGSILKRVSIKKRGFKKMYALFEKYALQQYSDDEVEDILDKALHNYLVRGNRVNWY